MAVSVAQIVAPQQLPNAVTLLYTSSGATRIDKFTVCNTTAGAATISIFLVPQSGVPGDGNTVSNHHSVAAGETWNSPDPVGLILNNGEALYAASDTEMALTVAAAGVVIA